MLTQADIAALTGWRHDRHRHPEVSGAEADTAAAVVAALRVASPDQVITGLGGHGVAAVFNGAAPGPTVMIRAELDALPIQELPGPVHRSRHPGVGHLCGHDGHMAIVLGVARLMAQTRPARGRVVLLFQPAEEDGTGAAAVMADPRFAGLRPDWGFALHNMPGLPLGQVQVAAGPANCASVGMKVALQGRTAHASTPHTGISPGLAVAALIPGLGALGQGGDLTPDFRLVTVTHARLGEAAFGIAPGDAQVWATLRTIADAPMAALRAQAVALVGRVAATHGLAHSIDWADDFAACSNDVRAVDHILGTLADTDFAPPNGPMRASEDFGRFAATGAGTAMFLIGAGGNTPALHSPDYDFPDALIGPGAALFGRIIDRILG